VRPVNIQKIKHRDNMTSRGRHSASTKIWLGLLISLAIIVTIGYALFYTPWLRVTTITFEGLSHEHQEAVQAVINSKLENKIYNVPVGQNILFTSASSLANDLKLQFSFIEEVIVRKKYFHSLSIIVTERKADGVWCFDSGLEIPDCRYFDNEGVTFGRATQSSGVLLLNVDDLRFQSASTSLSTVDQRFLQAIQSIIPTLTNIGVKVRKVTIPSASYTEFNILVGDPALSIETGSYVIKFSIDSNIKSQIDIFRIFRNQKITTKSLYPEYVDLRYDERVYFK